MQTSTVAKRETDGPFSRWQQWELLNRFLKTDNLTVLEEWDRKGDKCLTTWGPLQKRNTAGGKYWGCNPYENIWRSLISGLQESDPLLSHSHQWIPPTFNVKTFPVEYSLPINCKSHSHLFSFSVHSLDVDMLGKWSGTAKIWKTDSDA